jgi:hypothetical protein
MIKFLMTAVLILSTANCALAMPRNIAREAADKLAAEIQHAKDEINRLVRKVSSHESKRAKLEAEASHHDMMHDREAAKKPAPKKAPQAKAQTINH